MEAKIYFTIKLVCAVFIFRQLWIFIFNREMYGIWEKAYRLMRIVRITLWKYRKKRSEKAIRAATTIHHKMHDTVILSFLTDKLSNQEKVNRLVSECLDESGRPLAKRKTASKKVEAFNIDKFV